MSKRGLVSSSLTSSGIVCTFEGLRSASNEGHTKGLEISGTDIEPRGGRTGRRRFAREGDLRRAVTPAKQRTSGCRPDIGYARNRAELSLHTVPQSGDGAGTGILLPVG